MLPFILIAILEMGWIPNGRVENYDPPSVHLFDDTLYAEMGFSASLYGFYLGGDVRTLVKKTGWNIEFWPVGAWYQVNAGWQNDFLNVGWHHRCDHPVIAFPDDMGIPKWDAGYEEFFARVTLKLGP